MKWIYSKEDEQYKISLRKKDGTTVNFSYIDMIKELYEEKIIEEAEFEGDFSEEEKEAVNSLVTEINGHTQDFFKDDKMENLEN